VVGQVKTPGPYHVVPGGATVLDVLSLAGGATDKAAMTQVQIMHAGQTRMFNLRPLLFNINDPVGATRVVAGDVVSVPLNNNRIAVVGNVRNPQIYTIPDGEKWTVLTAVTIAGGPDNDGDKKRVGIVRPTLDGRMQLIQVNTEDLLRAKPGASDPLIQPGDILVVPKRNQPLNAFGVLQTGLGAALSLSTLSRLLGGKL
jgi:protein involved in polysaccharide export with SLBB domain